jgi:3-hydroxyacyl-[acyl-carrier-protein] dehydratase
MSRSPLVDLASLDLEHPRFGIEAVRRFNAHRHEMEQLSGIVQVNSQEGWIVGFRDVRTDEFWVRGHIPGRPIFPGVLMAESCAQLSSFYMYQTLDLPEGAFIGFGGLDRVRFRGIVTPPVRMWLIGRAVKITSRVGILDTQAVVDDRVVFEGRITGMML